MEYQSLLHKKLHDGIFVFTAETTPPDASNKEVLLEKTKPANDIDSSTLVTTANMMRKDKKFPSGRVIDPAPKLFIGGAEVPSKGKPNTEKILSKIKNGVDFFQTQYVFEAEKLKEYMKVLNDNGILEKKTIYRNFR